MGSANVGRGDPSGRLSRLSLSVASRDARTVRFPYGGGVLGRRHLEVVLDRPQGPAVIHAMRMRAKDRRLQTQLASGGAVLAKRHLNGGRLIADGVR